MIQLIDQHGNPLASTSDQQTRGGSGYEGAQNTETRDAFVAFPTNSRREINSFTRKEIQRKQRALSANLPIFNRINQKIGQHSVGKGIFVRPLTRDKEWNEINRRRYEKRCENPLLYSLDASCDLYEDQRFAAETLTGDGEFLEVFVRDPATKLPMVQRLDCFECETPREKAPGLRWNDGVLSNAYERPIGYAIRELPPEGYWTPAQERTRILNAASVIHLFKRRRARQFRGLPWSFTGINDGIDALDLKALIKGKAKLHAALAISVRKKAAEAGSKGIAAQIEKTLGTDGKPTEVREDFWRGAAIQYLATDEGIDLHTSDTPGENLLAFIEMLYREIAIGYGLPLEVVYNLASLGGATARAVLEDAQWLFDMVQDVIVMRHSRRHYLWDTADAIRRGELRQCRDPEWWVSAWRGPAKLTVDIGRSADAAIKLLKNGGLTHVRYHEERAQDAYEEAEEQIQFLAWVRGRCDESGVPYTDIIEPTPGAVNNVSVHTSDQAA